MKYVYVASVCCVLVACSAPNPAFQKPNASAQDVERQTLTCTAQAQREFPPLRGNAGLNAAVTVGGSFCDGPLCVGVSRGLGQAANVDRNLSLRKRAFNVCMADAGFLQTPKP